MLTILGLAAAVALVGWLATRGGSKRGSRAADEGKRFVLRVQTTPGRATRLGTSIETTEPPSHEPTLIADEAALLDGADKTIVIPAGQVLHVRAFDGGVRTALETVTTSSGAGRRCTFEVPAGVKFWILDAPGWLGCLSTTDPDRRRLPPRAEGYEVTTRLPPEPELDETGSIGVTMADLGMPLWMHGLEGPGDWLLGTRASAEPQVAIASFTDPYQDERSSSGDVGSACFQLLDTIWLETTARATAGVPIVVSRARILTGEGVKEWEGLDNWRRRFPDGTTLVWGAARRSLDDDGFDVRVRRSSESAAVELVAPLPALRREVVAALEARGVARATTVRLCRQVAPLPVELDGAYAAVVDLLFLLMLGNPGNAALPTQEPEVQRKIVDLSKDLADAAAPASEIGALVWIVAAIYAHECGGLAPAQRQAVIAFTRARTAEDDPIHRLAPAILLKLGELGDAAVACRAAIAWCEAQAEVYRGTLDLEAAAYRSWLDKVLAKASP